jgi:hypothetical protein
MRKIEQGHLAPPAGNNKGLAPGPAGNGGQKPQVQAKVFALNMEEVSADVVVAKGTFANHGCSVANVIDPDPAHSL